MPRRRILFRGARVFVLEQRLDVRCTRVLLIALFCFLRRRRNPQCRGLLIQWLFRSLQCKVSASRIAIQQTLAAEDEMHSPHILLRTWAQECSCSTASVSL